MEHCCCTCFSHPDVLRAVSLKWLIKLLEPHAAYLESRGLVLPGPDADWDDLDDKKLLSILMTPDPEMPKDLIDSLYYLHEMATPEAMDCLLEDAELQGIPIDDDPDPTPHDVAIQVWLHNSDLLKHHYAERSLTRPYVFVHFQGTGKHDRFWTPDQPVVEALQSDLMEWFDKRRRGRYCMIQFYAWDDCVRFVVGHGNPARREDCVCGRRHGSEFYRPEQHDLVIYRPHTGELQVHAGTQAQVRTYSKLFGRHLFGDDLHFFNARKYTLDPLKTDGEKALVCSDIDGLDSISLTRVRYQLSGCHSECETYASDDVFASMKERGQTIPDGAVIAEAGFSVYFRDSTVPRTMSVEPSDADGYERPCDSERLRDWFVKRGFAFFCQLMLLPAAQYLLQVMQDCDGVMPGDLL
jgi:hypothetical protein